MRISDWSSDVCSSDPGDRSDPYPARQNNGLTNRIISAAFDHAPGVRIGSAPERDFGGHMRRQAKTAGGIEKVIRRVEPGFQRERGYTIGLPLPLGAGEIIIRSEEHTSELQSLMRSSYAVFCLKKKTINPHNLTTI